MEKLDGRKAGREGAADDNPRRRSRFKSTPEGRDRAERTLRAFMTQHPIRWDEETRQAIRETEDLLPPEARVLSQLTGSAGAFTIPQDFMPELDRALKSYSGMWQAGRIVQTDTGSDLPWPKV